MLTLGNALFSAVARTARNRRQRGFLEIVDRRKSQKNINTSSREIDLKGQRVQFFRLLSSILFIKFIIE